ncbi:ankyrin repeat and btb poz domain-containing protein 1 isoform 2 [Nannochloropsis gaditana]|uniref:Ankyrin repeat and btb poz domain-containing protein 1 isoform 2 n=1 Tax=Nannochloropsis gaditana TaxID=72520 RepID=W7TQ17_9STRA|nr:ankyrin repeat and btb poz domain-containing protein 1 isoform 2 [Nannochloropsis gaditana]
MAGNPATSNITMAFPPHLDVWRAAREGNLQLLTFLIETKGHNVNVVNEVDASPLYYAALCGHVDCVKYLLLMGAVADEGTFMGERCFFAALNDPLRHLLRCSKMTRAYREPFLESLRFMYENKEVWWPDVAFVCRATAFDPKWKASEGVGSAGGVQEKSGLFCHQVILRARSAFLIQEFNKRRVETRCGRRGGLGVAWGTASSLSIPLLHSHKAFACILQYLYCSRLEMPLYLLDDGIRISRILHLPGLGLELQRASDKIAMARERGIQCHRELKSLKYHSSSKHSAFYVSRQRRQEMLIVEPKKETLIEHFKLLAEEVVTRFPEDADVVLFTGDGKSFALHRVILAARSPYFRTMLRSGFKEGQQAGRLIVPHILPTMEVSAETRIFSSEINYKGSKRVMGEKKDLEKKKPSNQDQVEEKGANACCDASEPQALPSIHLSLSGEALRRVIEFMYCDEPLSPLEVPLVFDVLDAATLFMLPGLRNYCVSALMEHVDKIDIFSLLEVARLYDLPRLENFVVERMAINLEKVVEADKFRLLVEESAATVKAREERDSIPLIDDIRYFVCRLHRFDQDVQEMKIALIESLLERLGLKT